MVQFNYQLTEDDFVKAARLYTATRRHVFNYSILPRRVTLWGAWIGYGVLFIVLVAVTLHLHKLPPHILNFFFFPALMLMFHLLGKWRSQRRYRITPILQVPHTIEADAKGLRITTATTDTRLKWHDMMRWAEKPAVFILVEQAERMYYAVSKRGVPEPSLELFRHMLQTHLTGIALPEDEEDEA